MDQALPWEESADAVAVSTAGTRPEPGPFGAAPVSAKFEEVEPLAPSDNRKARCPAGHPYDDGNTYVNRKGWRSCRTCKRISDRRRRARTAKNLTPQERVLRARLGAYRLHAVHDPKETTRKAREAFAARFEREVDPTGALPPAERARRAEAARRAYFTELALRSSLARRRAG
ncbi:MAG: hypothetical protein ACRD0C_07525 [Acidimicrobiia bacterium]